MTYPKRKSHHAHRVVRQLAKSCGAQEIGPDAAWLITVIAHVEDAKRYSGPVTFYNGQLMPIMGITKWDRFDRIRRRAVEAGWLHYEASPKGSRKAGVYWTLLPAELGVLDDAPIDETIADDGGSTLSLNGDCLGDQTGIVSGNERGSNGVMNRGTIVPNPIPIPNPIPKEEEVVRAETLVEAVDAFPCAGTPNAWRLTKEKLGQWESTFPELDVKGEIRKARQWILDSPDRKKTARGMPRFIGGWLGRAQNRPNGGNGKPTPVDPMSFLPPITDGSDKP